MDQYIGLDVSLKETSISVRQDGKRLWRGKCPSDPQVIAALISMRAPEAKRVVFETGPLSVWFYHELMAVGLPAICIDARHAAKALDMAPNKTDANDADGLAQLAEIGYFKEVRVKGYNSMLTRARMSARVLLISMGVKASNQIRGLMKTFGLVVPKGSGGVFEANVRRLLESNASLAQIILPMLQTWRSLRVQTAHLTRGIIAAARECRTTRLLMSIPGVGVITSTAFIAAVEAPEAFKSSRSVGAWLGLTTRRYQSGEVDYDGHISKRGDAHLRGLLYEAASVILSRVTSESALRTWGLKLREKIGYKRAAVAVARKLSVIMHTMLKTGELFDRHAGAPA